MRSSIKSFLQVVKAGLMSRLSIFSSGVDFGELVLRLRFFIKLSGSIMEMPLRKRSGPIMK